jgi:hypothetical protein
MADSRRTPAAYRRDLFLARQVIGQLRDQALESGDSFHVENRTFDAADLDALWDGLDRVDSHFWQVEELDACARAPKAENGPGGGSGDGNELPATGRPFRVLGQHRGTGAPANLRRHRSSA